MTSPLYVKVREAGEQDFEAVMAISGDIYGGLDYLPSLYSEICQDPRSNFFVAEIDGEVGAFNKYGIVNHTDEVGFKNCYLLDDNQTVVTMSARIKETHQGIGLMKTLTVEAIRQLRVRHPHIRRERYTSVMNDFFESLQRKPRQDLCIKQLWGVVVHTACARQMLAGLPRLSDHSSSSDRSLIQLGILEASATLTDPDHMGRLFNTAVFVAGNTWTPFKVSEAHLREVAESHIVWGTPGSKAGRYDALSFSSLCEVPGGVACDLYFHGQGQDTLINHVVKQLEHWLSTLQADTRVGLICHIPEGTCTQALKDTLNMALGATTSSSWPPGDVKVLVERQMNPEKDM